VTAALAVGLLASSTLVGCSSQSVDEASTAYCEQLDALRTEVDSLRALVATDATVAEVTEQRDAVAEAYQATVDAADDLDTTVRDAASGAFDAFQAAVSDIPTDQALSEAASQYTEAGDAFTDELVSIADDAGCS
jgi:phage shock protein A